MRKVVMFTVGLVAMAACEARPEVGSELDVTAAALGQPTGDYPNYDERVVLYATNRARVDPSAEGWPAYKAQPPLQWHHDLNRSARAHSQDMHDTPCFQHNSCNGGDMAARLRSFYTGPWMTLGENISTGRSVSDGLIAVHNWIYEIAAPAGETGHRDNIFSAKYTLLGAGFVAGGTQYQNYWTQDFIGTPVTRPRMTDGIHFPATVGAGGAVTFGVTFDDPAAPAQVAVAVVVGGTCTPLVLVRGAAARGAYEAKVSLPMGCHPYHFVATGGASEASYPDPGDLQVAVGVGVAACPLATTTRAVARCGALPDAGGVSPPGDAGGPGTGGGGAGATPDAGNAGGGDASSGTGGRATGGGSSAGGASGTAGSPGSNRDAGTSGQGGAGDTAGNGVSPGPAGANGSGANGGTTASAGEPSDLGSGCAIGGVDRSSPGGRLLPLTLAFVANVVGRRRRRVLSHDHPPSS